MGEKPKLIRQMGLITIIATGVSSMVGASINVVPFMITGVFLQLGPMYFGLLLLQSFQRYLLGLLTLFYLLPCLGQEGATYMQAGD